MQSAAIAPVLYDDFEDVTDACKQAVEGRVLGTSASNRDSSRREMSRPHGRGTAERADQGPGGGGRREPGDGRERGGGAQGEQP